jgi:hypothetical protein
MKPDFVNGLVRWAVAADKAGPRFLDWLAGSHLMA